MTRPGGGFDPRTDGGSTPRTDGDSVPRTDGDSVLRTDGGTDHEIDSITLEVIRNGCAAIAEEMNATLIRTGYSPNIKERRDCSCALFDVADTRSGGLRDADGGQRDADGGQRDADGNSSNARAQMISQAENMPVHLGAMPFSVAAAIERFPPGTLEPGDAVVLNDPFFGGAHLPDLTLVTPIFVEGDSSGETELIGFAANRAHHADIGGSRAGSVAADSTEIYQEGLRIPPVKLFRAGEVNEDVMEMILANVRTPDERRGDLRAQEAANETGRRRFQELATRYGVETLTAALAEIKDYSERRMRTALAEIPDGTYAFEDVLDDDGRGNEDLPIEVTITVEGDDVHVDFDGTAPQTEGPVNAVFAVTASATYYAIRCLTDPEIPPNHGCYRPIEIDAPAGSLVNASPPAAVVGGNLEVSQRVTDVILGAFAAETPERIVAACQGTMNNVTFGGIDPRTDEPYAFYETEAGGFGGRAGKDGMDGVHVHMTNTLNTPAEVLETAYPLRIVRYELRPDTGGAGAFRGGLGLRRDIEVRDHRSTFSLLADRRRSVPYGIAGGEAGVCGEDVLIRDGKETPLAPKSTHELEPGDVISVRTPGAGGYGNPADRDEAAVRRDVALGKLSAEAAREQYGVVIDEE